jgi:transposase
MAPRRVFEAIIFVLRTGFQWKALPTAHFGSPSAIHKYFLAWKRANVFVRLWRKGLAEYDGMEGIAWWWQSIDGTMVKAPLALEAVGPSPTDRGKKGTKRSVLVDGNGIPLSLVVSGAQRHDVALLEPTLDRMVVRRPRRVRRRQHLCADKGYVGRPADRAIRARGSVPHIPPCRQATPARRLHPHGQARRWVVERTHSWLNRYRKIRVRFEKTEMSYEALLELACALTTYRRVISIYG